MSQGYGFYSVETFQIKVWSKDHIQNTASMYQKIADHANINDLEIIDIQLQHSDSIVSASVLFRKLSWPRN